jgi:predicted DNA-binding WGR domain protein
MEARKLSEVMVPWGKFVCKPGSYLNKWFVRRMHVESAATKKIEEQQTAQHQETTGGD